jgi:hypothetical protein
LSALVLFLIGFVRLEVFGRREGIGPERENGREGDPNL